MIVSFWDHSFTKYFKDFIVLIHEMGHAAAALLTGGSVHMISIHGDESGETIALPSKLRGSFLFVVSAGYVGSAIVGAYLLNRGLSGKHLRSTLLVLGSVVLLLTFTYSQEGNLALWTGTIWGTSLLLLAVFPRTFQSLVLTFLGTGITLYSLYDLLDFTHGIQNTDAGILASYLTGQSTNGSLPHSVIVLGYLIAILWSVFSFSIIWFFAKRAFHTPEMSEELDRQEFGEQSPFPGEMTPEIMQWLMEKGLDENGNPLQFDLAEFENLPENHT